MQTRFCVLAEGLDNGEDVNWLWPQWQDSERTKQECYLCYCNGLVQTSRIPAGSMKQTKIGHILT